MSTSKQQVKSMPLKTLLQRVGQAKVPNSYVPDTNWGSNEPMLRSDRVNRLLMYCGAFNPPHIGHATVIADGLQHCISEKRGLLAAIVAPLDDTAIQQKSDRTRAAQPVADPGAKPPLLLSSRQRCDLLTGYFHGGDSNVSARNRPRIQVWGPGRLRGVAEFPGPIAAVAAAEGFVVDFILLRGSDHMHYDKPQRTSTSYDAQCSTIVFTEVAGRINPQTWLNGKPRQFDGGWTPWTSTAWANDRAHWWCRFEGPEASELRLLTHTDPKQSESGFSSTQIRKIVAGGGSREELAQRLREAGALSADLLVSILPDDGALYQKYVDQLTPLDDFIAQLPASGPTIVDFEIVDISDLTTGSSLPGLNEAKIVSIKQSTGPSAPPTSQTTEDAVQYVYKGAYYKTWLDRQSQDVGARPWEKFPRGLYEEHSLIPELLLLCTLPPHPNIIPRPSALVVTGTRGSPQRICGFLSPLRPRQTIEEQVANANSQNLRVPLDTKAKWCLGMAEGILHTHRAATTFHLDMKPGNVLLEDDDTVRIIDWQQQGMCRATHPPSEATLLAGPKIRRIVDKLRPGPDGQPRVVFAPRPGTWPESGLREAYVAWKAEDPAAVEAAEVYMLGRTMWMALEQVAESVAAATKLTAWTNKSADIPIAWKQAVMRCLEFEPAQRSTLEDLVRFWRDQVAPRDPARNGSSVVNVSVRIHIPR